MATHDERNAAHFLSLLEHAPGRQLSSEQLAEQTGWNPEELSAAVGILRGRQQVVPDDAALGSGNYGATSIMLPQEWHHRRHMFVMVAPTGPTWLSDRGRQTDP